MPLTILTGKTHPQLAQSVCDSMGIPLGAADIQEFSNENIFVQVKENVRHHDVFIIQPTSSPVNRGIMELLIMMDAVRRASAGRITAVIPYYGYGRSDKKDQPRVPITARLIADLLQTAGANRVLTMDLHAGQIQGFFSVPVDELTALSLLTRYFIVKNLPNPVVVSADIGGAKKARNFAERLDCPFAIIEKRRVRNDENSEALNVIGEVEGHTAIIVDDEINTAGTMLEAVKVLERHGVLGIYAAATHGIFSKDALKNLQKSSIKQVVVTDTVPLSEEGRRMDKVQVLSIAPLLGEAIQRIHTGQSVGAMFDDGTDDMWTQWVLAEASTISRG